MRLIDKQYALASAVSGIVRTDENGENWIRTRDVRESIMNNVPTIEAEPIKHGRWSRERLPSTDGGSYEVFRCNMCSEAFNWRTNYCPNCGAKMEGGENDR